jgi:hypothetical protein
MKVWQQVMQNNNCKHAEVANFGVTPQADATGTRRDHQRQTN